MSTDLLAVSDKLLITLRPPEIFHAPHIQITCHFGPDCSFCSDLHTIFAKMNDGRWKASKGQSFIIGYCWGISWSSYSLTQSLVSMRWSQHQQKFQPLKIHLSWCSTYTCVHAKWSCCCAPTAAAADLPFLPMGFVRTKSERQVDMTVDGEQLKQQQQQLGKRISSPPTFISAQCAKVQLFAIHAEKTTRMFLRWGAEIATVKCK